MKISLHEESAITTKIKPASTPTTSLSVLIITSITLSLVALTMQSTQEISAAECTSNNDDETNTNNKNNNNNDESTTTCANQKQQHSKNQDPSSASNIKSSIPLRFPMPFP
jgi:hypothetical protein